MEKEAFSLRGVETLAPALRQLKSLVAVQNPGQAAAVWRLCVQSYRTERKEERCVWKHGARRKHTAPSSPDGAI